MNLFKKLVSGIRSALGMASPKPTAFEEFKQQSHLSDKHARMTDAYIAQLNRMNPSASHLGLFKIFNLVERGIEVQQRRIEESRANAYGS